MNCDEAKTLIHALIDGELDAGHARAVEAHAESCADCAAALRDYRGMRAALSAPGLRHTAPASLRARIDRIAPAPRLASRRDWLKGMTVGAGVSAIAASGLFFVALKRDERQTVLNEIVSAHLRSLQGDHLIDVQSGDQHTVKPWFNGRLDVAPPVIDLTAQGFTLLGGRLDYLAAKPVAAIVYRRRIHVINLFVSPAGGDGGDGLTSLHGFNVRRWRADGFSLWAVSDINPDELEEFADRFQAALRK